MLPKPRPDIPSGYRSGKEFYVDPHRLKGLVRVLERVSDDTLRCLKVLSEVEELTETQGWLNELSGAHDGVMKEVKTWLRNLKDVAMKNSETVRKAVEFYQATDTENAKRFDEENFEGKEVRLSSYPFGLDEIPDPWGSVIAADVPPGNDPFGYYEDPLEPLDDIGTYDEEPAFQVDPEYANLLSLATDGMSHTDAIRTATGYAADLGILDKPVDPVPEMVEPVVGDWAAFRRCADTLDAISTSVYRMAWNLEIARRWMEPVWRGRAADEFVYYLGQVTDRMTDGSSILQDHAKQYKKAAEGQAGFRTVVSALLDGFLNASLDLVYAVRQLSPLHGISLKKLARGALTGFLLGLGLGSFLRVAMRASRIREKYELVCEVIDSVKAALNDLGQLQRGREPLPELPGPMTFPNP